MAIYFNSILNPFGLLNIASFYLNYYSFIDALVYLILFLSVAKIVFAKVYKDNKKEAKMIAVAIALCLTISMIVLEMNTGFNIGQLAPVALIIFLLVLAVLLYNLMLSLFPLKDGQKVSMHSAALTYLIIYGLLIVPFGTLYRWIQTNAPLLSGVLELAGVVAFIYIIIELFSVLGLGGDPKKDSTLAFDPTKQKDSTDPTKPDGDKKTEKEYPENIRSNIGSDYASAVDTLSSSFQDYAQLFHQIITTHNAGPKISGEAWTKLFELRSNMVKAIDNANNILDAIRRQDKYSEVNAKDISVLTEVMSKHESLIEKILTYEKTARLSYNDNKITPPGKP